MMPGRLVYAGPASPWLAGTWQTDVCASASFAAALTDGVSARTWGGADGGEGGEGGGGVGGEVGRVEVGQVGGARLLEIVDAQFRFPAGAQLNRQAEVDGFLRVEVANPHLVPAGLRVDDGVVGVGV